MHAIFIILISALICFLLINKSIPYLENILPDKINKRSIHSVIKARGGGIFFSSIPFLFVLNSLFYRDINTYEIIYMISYPISLIGLLDDKFSLNKRIRFISHIVIALSIIQNSNNLVSSSNFFDQSLIYFFYILIICSSINLVNFIDGMDGMLISCILLPLIILCIKFQNPTIILILIGCLLGFLILNWHPAKIFMGDSGSTFLGLVYSALSVQSANINISINLLSLLGPIYIDTIITIIKRIILKQNILKGHKLHLYQRLYKVGFKQTNIVFLYFLSSLLITLGFVLFERIGIIIAYSISIIIYFYLDLKISNKKIEINLF